MTTTTGEAPEVHEIRRLLGTAQRLPPGQKVLASRYVEDVDYLLTEIERLHGELRLAAERVGDLLESIYLLGGFPRK